jgi:hypothetical protein
MHQSKNDVCDKSVLKGTFLHHRFSDVCEVCDFG